MNELSGALLLVSRTCRSFAARMVLALVVLGLAEEQEHLRLVLHQSGVLGELNAMWFLKSKSL